MIKKLSESSSLEKMSNKAKVIQGIKVRNEELQADKTVCKGVKKFQVQTIKWWALTRHYSLREEILGLSWVVKPMKMSSLCFLALKKANQILAVINKAIGNKAEDSNTPLYKSTLDPMYSSSPLKAYVRSKKDSRKGKKNGGKYGRASTGGLDGSPGWVNLEKR